MSSNLAGSLAVAALLVSCPLPSGAAYPERPITMIIAFAPGGGTDIAARAMVPYLEKQLAGNARIVVVNRPGAAGEIGFNALASAAPDGYTIGFFTSTSVQIAAIQKNAPPLWPRLDLIGNVVDDPQCFTVHSDSQFKNLGELISFAKANPDALQVGVTGTGIAAKLVERAAGVKFNIIPYKGGGEVRIALTGRQIVVASHSIGEALQLVKGGISGRVIAVFSDRRSPIAANVPTGREQGVDVELASLRGIAAPKGLSPEVRERLVKAVAQAVANPEFQQKSIALYAPIRYLSPPQLEAALREGDARLRQLWKDAPWAVN